MAVSVEECSEITMRAEAEFIVREVAYSVDDIQVSKTLPGSEDVAYINLTTQEKQTYCLELSTQGFTIIGKEYDKIDDNLCGQKSYETIYALLDTVSPGYRKSFGNALSKKLENLQKENL